MNSSNLSDFQKNVDTIDYLEWKLFGSTLSAIGLSYLSFILSIPTAGAGTLTAGLAALGAYEIALESLVKLAQHANSARIYYFRL